MKEIVAKPNVHPLWVDDVSINRYRRWLSGKQIATYSQVAQWTIVLDCRCGESRRILTKTYLDATCKYMTALATSPIIPIPYVTIFMVCPALYMTQLISHRSQKRELER